MTYIVNSEHYNVSERDAKENSSLCAGDSKACMCISTDYSVEIYSTIEVYTLEEDGVTRSRISVPTVREDVSEIVWHATPFTRARLVYYIGES